jgi:hypothetical protein
MDDRRTPGRIDFGERDQVNHQRKELTVTGKRNQRRVIDLVPFGGYPLFATLPAFVGKENLFWRSGDKRARSDSKRQLAFIGDKIEDPGPTFKRITRAVEEWAAEHGVEFRPFRRGLHLLDQLLSADFEDRFLWPKPSGNPLGTHSGAAPGHTFATGAFFFNVPFKVQK